MIHKESLFSGIGAGIFGVFLASSNAQYIPKLEEPFYRNFYLISHFFNFFMVGAGATELAIRAIKK